MSDPNECTCTSADDRDGCPLHDTSDYLDEQDNRTLGGSYDEAISLTVPEADALARRMIARHLAAETDWLQWEDVPYLGEYAFVRLCAAVHNQAALMAEAARNHDGATGIDSADILSRAIG